MGDTDRYKEIENNLRSELLDHGKDNINRWMAAIALFLALLTFLSGYIIFDKSKEATQSAAEARKLAREAKKLVADIKEQKNKVLEHRKELENIANTSVFIRLLGSTPGIIRESEKTVEKFINAPDASDLDRAIANALDLQQKGDIDKALEQWHSLANITSEIGKDDIAAVAWLNIGNLTDSEEALQAYDKAITFNPSYVDAYIGLGIIKMNLGKNGEAVKDFDHAISIERENALAHYGRGLANQALQDSPQAIIDYKIALVLLENNPEYANLKDQIEQNLKAIEK